MSRKKREYECENKFESASKEPKYCSTDCSSIGQGKIIRKGVISKCVVCGKKIYYQAKQ